MPPAKYFIFAILAAGALGAVAGLAAPAPADKGWRGRVRRLLSAAAVAAAVVCVDAGLRYVRGGWPAFWPADTTHRLLVYSVILFGGCAVGALAPGGRGALLVGRLAALGACMYILLAPLTREWGSAGHGLIVAGWAALGAAASLSSHALARSLALPVGVASLTALPLLAAGAIIAWGKDATQSMTVGGLIAIAAGLLAVNGLRRFRASDAWATPIWWGVLALALASASHYSRLAPAAGALLLAAPTVAAAAAFPVRRRGAVVRAALAGAGLAAAAAAGVVIAWMASGSSAGGYGY